MRHEKLSGATTEWKEDVERMWVPKHPENALQLRRRFVKNTRKYIHQFLLLRVAQPATATAAATAASVGISVACADDGAEERGNVANQPPCRREQNRTEQNSAYAEQMRTETRTLSKKQDQA